MAITRIALETDLPLAPVPDIELGRVVAEPDAGKSSSPNVTASGLDSRLPRQHTVPFDAEPGVSHRTRRGHSRGCIRLCRRTFPGRRHRASPDSPPLGGDVAHAPSRRTRRPKN